MTNQDVPQQIDAASFATGGDNTEISYMYRDADNYKQHETTILPGALTLDQARAVVARLDEDQYFVPSAVGLADLQERMVSDWDEQSDHAYHEMGLISLTSRPATDTTTATEFADLFAKADWTSAAAEVVARHA